MKPEFGCSCSTCVILRAQEREILIGKDPVPAPYPLTWSEPVPEMKLPGLRRDMPAILIIGGSAMMLIACVANILITASRPKLPVLNSPDNAWSCYGDYAAKTWICVATQADGKSYIFENCEIKP